jgi:hypothetical protein
MRDGYAAAVIAKDHVDAKPWLNDLHVTISAKMLLKALSCSIVEKQLFGIAASGSSSEGL